MICPMKFNDKTLDKEGTPHPEACVCEEDGCAWWVSPEGNCALPSIVMAIRSNALTSAKMPEKTKELDQTLTAFLAQMKATTVQTKIGKDE